MSPKARPVSKGEDVQFLHEEEDVSGQSKSSQSSKEEEEEDEKSPLLPESKEVLPLPRY